MRIEIDTKNDTKEELGHLARMLLAMSGGGAVKPKYKDLFSDDSSSVGTFDQLSQGSPAENTERQPGIFSMFDTPVAQPEKKDVVDELKLQPY